MLTISYKPLTITNNNKYTYNSLQTFPKNILSIICVVYMYIYTILFITDLPNYLYENYYLISYLLQELMKYTIRIGDTRIPNTKSLFTYIFKLCRIYDGSLNLNIPSYILYRQIFLFMTLLIIP